MLTINKDDIASVDELSLTAEEKANLKLLNIRDGTLISVVDKKKLVGSLVLPDSVTEIGNRAFSGCIGLTGIVIPDSVTKIREEIFHNCSSLTSVVLPRSITEIGEEAFSCCTSLTKITIPDSVKEICWAAFSGCTSLTSVVIPDSVTAISEDAFTDINLDAHFIVSSESVKNLLRDCGSGIRDEQIIVKQKL